MVENENIIQQKAFEFAVLTIKIGGISAKIKITIKKG